MNRRQLAVVLLIVAVAAFFRFYRLDSIPPGLHADEAVNGNDALIAWRMGRYQLFYPENNCREGLYINLQAVTLGLVGIARPWVLRLPSAVLGTLTVLGVYAIARLFGVRRTAWLATLFMAVSLWQVNVARMGDRRVAALFFLVWALWLVGKAVAAAQENRQWLSWSIAAGLVYGLGFHTYVPYQLTPALLLLVFWQYKHRAAWRVAAVAGAVAAVVILPLGIFAVQRPDLFFHRVHQLSTLPTTHPVRDVLRNTWETAGMLNFVGDTNPRHNIPGRPILFWPVSILFFVGIVVAVRRQRLLLWWLGIGLVPAVFANEGVPHSYRAMMAGPAVFFLAALGAEWFIARCKRPALAEIFAVVLALAVTVEGYWSYFVVWARDPQVAEWFDGSLLKVAARLNELPRELPKYVILDPDPMTVRGLPFAAQTIMFLTDTATTNRQEAKNLHYLWPDQTNQIARGYVYVYHIETTQP